MAVSARLVPCILALLTILASVTEIALASWVLYYLNTLRDQVNYAYGGIEESSANPVLPSNQTLTFEQPWVVVQSGIVWAVPRTELAAGTIAFALGLLICVLLKIRSSGKSGSRYVVSDFGTRDRIAIVLPLILALAITVLFAYVFVVSGYSAGHAKLSLGGALGGSGWDATPTWEVWTCAMSSFLDKHSSIPAARSEWNDICRMTTGARWALLPVFILAILSVFQYYWSSSAEAQSASTKSVESLSASRELDTFGG